MGFLDRYTAKVEQYWKDNYETNIKPNLAVDNTKEAYVAGVKVEVSKEQEKQSETPKKTSKKRKKE